MSSAVATLGRVRKWWRAWWSAYLPAVARRRPRVRLRLGPSLPCWLLRIVVGLLVVACGATVLRGPLAWVVLIMLAAALVAWPAGVGAGAIVIVIAVMVAAGPPLGNPVTAGLVAGLPALVQLAQLIGRTSWAARIGLRALVVPLPRFLAIQAFVQPLALLGAWLRGVDLALAWLAPVALLGVGVLTYRWLPRLASSLGKVSD
jgi:hypothetical protein